MKGVYISKYWKCLLFIMNTFPSTKPDHRAPRVGASVGSPIQTYSVIHISLPTACGYILNVVTRKRGIVDTLFNIQAYFPLRFIFRSVFQMNWRLTTIQSDRKITQPILKYILMVAIQYNSTGLINTQYRCDYTRAHADHVMLKTALASSAFVLKQSKCKAVFFAIATSRTLPGISFLLNLPEWV
jgi:hypothetical protein